MIAYVLNKMWGTKKEKKKHEIPSNDEFTYRQILPTNSPGILLYKLILADMKTLMFR